MNRLESTPFSPPRAQVPSRYERVAALATSVGGGPVGRFATIGRRGWAPAAAFLSALSSVWVALSVLQRGHCVSNGWATPGSLWRYCYSDLPVAVSVPAGSHPWASSVIGDQPPLTAVLTWAVRLLLPGGQQLHLQQGMFAIGAVIIAALIAWAVCLLAASMPRSPWAAAHLALSPVLLTASLTSFDALGVLFVAAAFYWWSHEKYIAVGFAGMAAFLTRPLLGVVLVAFMCVATTRESRVWQRMLYGSVATLAFTLSWWMTLSTRPTSGLEAWSVSGASYGSFWYALSLAGITLSPSTLTTLAVIGWVIAIGLGLVLAHFERISHPAPIALVLLLVVLVFARAVPVQAALWVLPLLAACAVPWRDHLIWAAAEFGYFLIVWPFVARASNPGKALPDGWYITATIVRFAALIYLVRSVARTGPTSHSVGAHSAPELSTDFAPHVGNR